MIYRPRNDTERHAIRSAQLAGCEYRTYEAGGAHVAYRVIREHKDGTFDLERLADQPAVKAGRP